MKHFKNFPKIYYPAKISPNGVQEDLSLCTNIMLAARFREVLKNNTVYFYPYIIHDEDRPDILSHKYYGSPDYAWVILYANNILDPLYDWPLTYHDFVSYLRKKYGTIEYAQSTIKQYKNKNGFVVDEDSWLALPVVDRDQDTIYEWENQLNEDKRKIRILEDVYLNKVLLEFRDLLKESNRVL